MGAPGAPGATGAPGAIGATGVLGSISLAYDDRLFYVQGWGQAGAANLFTFVELGYREPWRGLALNELAVGQFIDYRVGSGEPSIFRTDRITRIR